MKKVLIVVDYQIDFVNGKLGFSGAELIENNILDLIKRFEGNNDLVIFTKDTHFDDYMSTEEGKNLPVSHCIKGTSGHELTDGLKKEVKDHLVIEKYTFPSLELGNILAKEEIEEIYLCGLVSDICVFTNAIIAKAAKPNATIYIHKDASASYDKEMEAMAYKVIEHLHVKVI
jgi:nicotinamidase-related amidase